VPSIELSVGTIDYDDSGGDGPVVVLLHGMMMDRTVWREVVVDLRDDHRCVVPTMPLGAHRQPMREDADLSLLGQALLIGEFLDRLDLVDVTLVANDWGGPQVTAVECPERIARLVLVATEAFDNIPPGLPGKVAGLAARLPGGILMSAQMLRIPILRRLPFTFGWMTKRDIPSEMFAGWLAPMRTKKEVRRDLAKYIRTTDDRSLLAAADKLASFDRPVLIVWGIEERVMPFDHARRLAELIPDSRLIEVTDSYTLVPIDQPTKLASAIRQFVRGENPTHQATTAPG